MKDMIITRNQISTTKHGREESEEHESDDGNFLKPFLSGWQRVWSNRKKWFGTGAECQDQPKIPIGSRGDCQTESALPVELQKQHQHQSLRKDPASVVHAKYRRMSLKQSGGRRSSEAVPRSSQTLFQLTDDERPLSQVHTQVDYTNFLIPSQSEILNSPFYWGKIDRYEAEALLANRPEGSFLLRDSAQDDFVFSVSFRRYGRSLHARIEEVRVFVSFRDDLNSGKSPVVVPAVFQGVWERWFRMLSISDSAFIPKKNLFT